MVLPHGRYERPRQIDAELPHHPSRARRADQERAVRCFRELARPQIESRIPGDARHLIEGVHPLREVMEVLAVSIPFEIRVEGLVRRALGKRRSWPATRSARWSRPRPRCTDQGRRVAGARPHIEDTLAAAHFEHVEGQRDVRLRDRLPFADWKRRVVVGELGELLRQGFARDAPEGIQDGGLLIPRPASPAII